jgi:hypothetical protein
LVKRLGVGKSSRAMMDDGGLKGLIDRRLSHGNGFYRR